jgi:SAM-dependent methyltransferase
LTPTGWRAASARARQSGEFYAHNAPQWDRLRAGLDVEGLHASLVGALLPGDLDIVDAGTGTGALLPLLAPAARRLMGIDRSPEMLAEARARVGALGLTPSRWCAPIWRACRSPTPASMRCAHRWRCTTSRSRRK